MKILTSLFAVPALGLVLAVPVHASRNQPVLVTIDIPGASTTSVNGINDRGDIAGNYTTPDGVEHGFVRKGRVLRSIDHPDPTRIGTQAWGINARGDVAGSYKTTAPCTGCPDWMLNAVKGFVLRDGRFATVEVPGAMYTIALGINASGMVVGEYWTDRAYGFTFDGRVYRQIDRSESTDPLSWSSVYGINDRGDLAGWFGSGETWIFHGYVMTPRGAVTVIDPPGSTWNLASGINSRGIVLGVAYDANGASWTFLWMSGKFATVTVPGATWTYPGGLNNRGDVVGQYGTPDGRSHGFVLTRGAER